MLSRSCLYWLGHDDRRRQTVRNVAGAITEIRRISSPGSKGSHEHRDKTRGNLRVFWSGKQGNERQESCERCAPPTEHGADESGQTDHDAGHGPTVTISRKPSTVRSE